MADEGGTGEDGIMDLVAKVQYLLDTFVPMPEGHFTFPDGDTWLKTEKGE